MPEKREIVINTGPLVALVAAMGDLRILDKMYTRVIVPHEVACEVLVENATRFGSAEFEAASWLEKASSPLTIAPALRNVLDAGEAAVIQWALNEGITTVCIDEAVGRRIARLNGLRVTGSLGILIRAKRDGHLSLLSDVIRSMRDRGIRLSADVERLALEEAGEILKS